MILTVAAIKPLGHGKLEKVMEKGMEFEELKKEYEPWFGIIRIYFTYYNLSLFETRFAEHLKIQKFFKCFKKWRR